MTKPPYFFPDKPFDIGQWHIPEGDYRTSIEFYWSEQAQRWNVSVHLVAVPSLDEELRDLTMGPGDPSANNGHD